MLFISEPLFLNASMLNGFALVNCCMLFIQVLAVFILLNMLFHWLIMLLYVAVACSIGLPVVALPAASFTKFCEVSHMFLPKDICVLYQFWKNSVILPALFFAVFA